MRYTGLPVFTKTKEVMLKVSHAEVGTTPIIHNIPKEEGRSLVFVLFFEWSRYIGLGK